MAFSSSDPASHTVPLQLSSHNDELCGAMAIPETLRHAWHPATHALYEWTNYTVHCEEADELRIASRRISPLAPGLFWLRFENRLGLVEIQALRHGRSLGRPLWVEVLSPKFSTLQAHHRFWNALIDELFARLKLLPFTFEAPTKHRVQQRPQSTLMAPAPLWAWHFFLSCGRELQRALSLIEAHPHRAMREHWQRVPLWENHAVDAETCFDIMRSPETWRQAASNARDYPIAQRLNGHLPQTVAARQMEETRDTPLNRWLCGALRTWLEAARALKSQFWWARVGKEKQQRVGEIESALQRALNVLDLPEGATKVLSSGTMPVLTRRAGYAQVWDLWQRFHQMPKPLWAHCQTAIDVRDVATLYEVWTFFALAQSIGVALNSAPQWELRTSDVVGLQSRSVAHFGKNRSLIYNRRTRGYSSILRPDFTWIDGDTIVVFDAKFRLDQPSVAPAQSTLDGATATQDDLWTMHAYRDALGARAAVAIYPGQRSVFYAVDGGAPNWADNAALLRQIVQGQKQGIGALAMRPSAEN